MAYFLQHSIVKLALWAPSAPLAAKRCQQPSNRDPFRHVRKQVLRWPQLHVSSLQVAGSCSTVEAWHRDGWRRAQL